MGFIHAWLFIIGHWQIAVAIAALLAASFLLPFVYPPALKIWQFVVQYWYLVVIVLLLVVIHGVDMQASTAERYMVVAQSQRDLARNELKTALDANQANQVTIDKLRKDAKDGVLSLNTLLADKDAQIAAIQQLCEAPAQEKPSEPAPSSGKRKRSPGMSLDGLRKFERDQLGPPRR